MTLHSGGELGLSQAAYLHLAASIPNMTLAIDSELDYLAGDIVDHTVRDRGRQVCRCPLGPGLGVAVDPEELATLRGRPRSPARISIPRVPDWFPTKPAY